MAYPKIRPIEAIPVEVDNRSLVYLRDPIGYATQSLLLPRPAFFVASLFDGHHSIPNIQEKFERQFGETLPRDSINELIAELDLHYYMEGDRFATRERDVRSRFRETSVRPLAHAGSCYDTDPERFRTQLDSFFTDPVGPGLPECRQSAPVIRAVIAPHIDLRAGGPCYAWAYREIAERSDAEVFVLLGTAHAASSHPFILTTKDFDTPLGPVQADASFIARLQEAYGGELIRDEILHRNEHSLEFQALFLRHILGTARPFSIVPILVGSFHHMVESGRPPCEDPAIGGFITALRSTMAADSRSICLIAGVDFAHVGRKFGDTEGLDPNFLGWVEAEDQILISALERADAEGFFNAIAKDKDRRRVCGFSAMYTLLSTLEGSTGRLLRYDRSDDLHTQSAVSFASLAFD